MLLLAIIALKSIIRNCNEFLILNMRRFMPHPIPKIKPTITQVIRGSCFWCDMPLIKSNYTIDHLLSRPMTRKFPHVENKTVPCCVECNQRRGFISSIKKTGSSKKTNVDRFVAFSDFFREKIKERVDPAYRDILLSELPKENPCTDA